MYVDDRGSGQEHLGRFEMESRCHSNSVLQKSEIKLKDAGLISFTCLELL